MKVLHIAAGNLFGGIETMLVTLTRHSSAQPELQHEFAVSFEGRLTADLRAASANVTVLGPVRLSRPLSVRRARQALASVLQQAKPDVVLYHGHWTLTAFGSVARQAGIPLLLWVHGPPTHPHWIDRVGIAPRPNCLIANGSYIAALAEQWLPGIAVRVMYYPVDDPATSTLRSRADVREELATSDAAIVIVLAGRMEAWKGQKVLIAALAKLRADTPWQCWIAGGVQRACEAAYMAELQTLASAHGIFDRVRFCGDRRDVPSLLAAADIYCQPNPSPEPFGISFIEAMYRRLPVVASASGGPAEIVTPDCGILVTPGNVDEVAAALATLIHDAWLRSRMGERGRDRAIQMCSPSARLLDLAQIVRDATGTQGTDRPAHTVVTGT